MNWSDSEKKIEELIRKKRHANFLRNQTPKEVLLQSDIVKARNATYSYLKMLQNLFKKGQEAANELFMHFSSQYFSMFEKVTHKK